jgi:hypothetical protein
VDSSVDAVLEKSFAPGYEVVRLLEGMGRDGLLTRITEPVGLDTILAYVGSAWVELPRSFSAELHALMGQKVRTAKLDGKYWVGRMT